MIRSYLTKSFLLGAADRAVKSFAQALLLFFGADQLDVLAVDWSEGLALAAGAVVLSVLTSIVSGPVGEHGTTSAIVGGR